MFLHFEVNHFHIGGPSFYKDGGIFLYESKSYPRRHYNL